MPGVDVIRWAGIPEFEDLYSVNSLGEIYSRHFHRLLKPWDSGQGYRSVRLHRAGQRAIKKYVHRLVATAFVEHDGDPEKIEVEHLNGKRGDNRAENLLWVTRRQQEWLKAMRRREEAGQRRLAAASEVPF